MTITEFILQRVAEDEAVARDWSHHPAKVRVAGGGSGYLALANPARVLAECEAYKEIVEMVAAEDDGTAPPQALILGDNVLLTLATIYADHPDYRDEWRL